MAAVDVPVLGIVGSADAYLADFRALERLIPKMQLVVIDGATHGSAPHRPEFVAALRAFLDAAQPAKVVIPA
jgi:pimeloyl-ACP methyl ester carboxylesterase